MIRTMLPGEGDDMSREAEIQMLRDMMAGPTLDERRAQDAASIGRRMLRADIFGDVEYPAPFELPQRVPHLLHLPFYN